MSSTPRSVGSEKRVSFAVRLEDVEPEQINAVVLSPNKNENNNTNSSLCDDDEDLNSPSSAATRSGSPAEFSPSKMDGSPEEERVADIMTSLSQIKQDVELGSISKPFVAKDSASGKDRGPWSMACFVDINLCAPQMRGAEDLSSPIHRIEKESTSDLLEEDNSLDRDQPPSSPVTDFPDTTLDEDAFLPDFDEAFLPLQGIDEAFLPADADDTFLDAAFLPSQDESAFLPHFPDKYDMFTKPLDSVDPLGMEEQKPQDDLEEPTGYSPEPPTTTMEEATLAGELFSEEATTLETAALETTNLLEDPVDMDVGMVTAADDQQQTTITQSDDQAEVEVEITSTPDAAQPVVTESHQEEQEEGQIEVEATEDFEIAMDECDPTTTQIAVNEGDPTSTTQQENQEEQDEEAEVEATEDPEVAVACDSITTNEQEVEPEVEIEDTGDLEETGESESGVTLQNNNNADNDQNDTEEHETPSTPEKEPTVVVDDVEVDDDEVVVDEFEPECLNSDQCSQEHEHGIIDAGDQENDQDNNDNSNHSVEGTANAALEEEYPSINMEYTQSINSDVIIDRDNRDSVIEELRILLAKSQEEKEKAVQAAVKDTEIRLRQDRMEEEVEIANATKPDQHPQNQSTTRVHFEEEHKLEEDKQDAVVKIAGAMKVASVIKNQFSGDDEDAGEINTLKNSLGNLLKHQKETIESLKAKLVERDSTIEQLKAECSSTKDKFTAAKSSLSFAERTLISLKAENTTAKRESKATIEKMKAELRTVENAFELAKQGHASELEQSATTIATLKASLVDTNESLDQANAQLVVMEEQQVTIKNLQSSLQEAENRAEQAKADAAQVVEQLKESVGKVKTDFAEMQEQLQISMAEAKADSEKAEEQLKETIVGLQRDYQEMRSLCNQQSTDIVARESTITDLKDQIERLEASALAQRKTDENLLQENQRLNSLLEQQQLTLASKERSLGDLKQEIRDLVESVQEADTLREELQTEHEQSISELNERVKSLSMDCESLKSIVSLQSKESENYDGDSDVKKPKEPNTRGGGEATSTAIEVVGTPSNTQSYDTASEGRDCNSDNMEEKTTLKIDAGKTGPGSRTNNEEKTAGVQTKREPRKDTNHPTEELLGEAVASKSEEGSTSEVVDPMFCSSEAMSEEETVNSACPAFSDDLEDMVTDAIAIPGKVCREQLQKMDGARRKETGKLSFNRTMQSLACGCVAGSSMSFPDTLDLVGTNSIIDTDQVPNAGEEPNEGPNEAAGTEMLPTILQESSLDDAGSNAQENSTSKEATLKPSLSTDSSQVVDKAIVDKCISDVLLEGDEDAGLNEIETVLNLEACNIPEELSLLKSKSSSSEISSKESRDLTDQGALSMDLTDYVDGSEVIPMTKKLESLSGELITKISETKEDCADTKAMGLEDKVGIFKVAFKTFQGEKEKLLKEAEAEKTRAIEEMRAQLEEEKRAFIEEQEKRYGKITNKTAKSPWRQTKSKSPVRQTVKRAKSKSPERHTKPQSKDSLTTIQKAKASLKKTTALPRQNEQTGKPKAAPRVPLYLRSSGDPAKSQKIPKPGATASAKSSATRSTSVTKATARRPSAIRAPSPGASRPSLLRAPSPSASRPSLTRAPSPSASRPSLIRAPSPSSSRPSSTRTGLSVPTPRSSLIKTKVIGSVKTSTTRSSIQTSRPSQPPPRTNSRRSTKLGKPQEGGDSELQGSSAHKNARQKNETRKGEQTISCEKQRPTIAISSLEDSFSSLMRKREGMTPSKGATASPRFLLADPQEKNTQEHEVQEERTSSKDDCKKEKEVEVDVEAEAESSQSIQDVASQFAEPGAEESGEDASGVVPGSTDKEPDVEIVYSGTKNSSQGCREAQSEEMAEPHEARTRQEQRGSVPECLDLLNAEISNSDCDLENESEEEDAVLEDFLTKVLSNDSEFEAAGNEAALSHDDKEEVREELQSQRSDIGTREDSARYEYPPDPVVSCEPDEEGEELNVSPSKNIRRSTRLATTNVADV